MNKKILIGSMLVLTLLLLMPSIPSIQHKVVKDEIINELPENLYFKDVKEIKELEQIKYPSLYAVVLFFLNCRWKRFEILQEISYDITVHGTEIKRPILFLRCLMLLITTFFLCDFWESLSNLLGWGWEIPY